MDDIDKIHELLKAHGSVLERTKKHKMREYAQTYRRIMIQEANGIFRNRE